MEASIPKIISGGQTGADRAALDWALSHNLPNRITLTITLPTIAFGGPTLALRRLFAPLLNEVCCSIERLKERLMRRTEVGLLAESRFIDSPSLGADEHLHACKHALLGRLTPSQVDIDMFTRYFVARRAKSRLAS